MTRVPFIITVAALLASCVAQPEFDYESLVSQTTPASWDTKSVWVFVAVDRKGVIIRSLALRFTDQPAESCASGDWKKVEILRSSGNPNSSVASQSISAPTGNAQPGYKLNGRALNVGLTTNLCDSYVEFLGELTDEGFSGRFISTGLFHYEDFGKVYGARADPE